MPDTGDTPHLATTPAYVDPNTGTGHNPPAQGDEPLPGVVRLVEDTSTYHQPTAAELRANGYVVPDQVEDSAVPTTVIEADQPVPAGEVNLYVPDVPDPSPVNTVPPDEAPPEPERPDAPEEAEEPEPTKEAEQVQDSSGNQPEGDDPNFVAGLQAALDEQPRSSNPNDGRRAEGRAWFRGYDSVTD